MAFRDRIEVVVDFVTSPAQKGLGKLKADVAAADGAMGKAKAAATNLGSTLSAYAGPAALAGAAAFVEFGRRSVAAFQETALAAGQFSDATGIAVEDASRWIAVGDDFGISAESIQGAFMRMNRAIAGGAFEKYGIDVKRAADGTVDANATFQNAVTTIGRIPDATQRAQVAQEVFGRGYASIARIMEMDAKSLADALGSVSDQQVIDAEESAKAREFQAAMDNLQDSVQDLMLALGEGLVPALTDAANTATTVIGPIMDLNEATDGFLVKGPLRWGGEKLSGIFGKVKNAIQGNIRATQEYEEEQDEAADRADYYGSRMAALAEDEERAAGAADRLRDAISKKREQFDKASEAADAFRDALDRALGGGIALEEANQAIIEGFQELTDSVTENGASLDIMTEKGRANRDIILDQVGNISDLASALVDQGVSAEDATGYVNAYREELIKQAEAAGFSRDEVEKYLDELGLTPTKVETEIKAVGKQKALEDLIEVLDQMGPIDEGVEAEITAAINEGDFALAEARINELVRDRAVNVAIGLLNPFGRNGSVGGLSVNGGIAGRGMTADDAGIAGRSAGGASGTSGRPAVMAANALWQQALSAWGGASGMSQRDKLKRRFNNELERGRRKYQVGDFGGSRYFAYLEGLQKKYDWPRLSDEWMALWQEMDRVLRDMDIDFDGMGGSATGTSARSGSSGMPGSSSGGGVPAGSGGRSGMGGRVTNINIELRGLFVGTEAEMRKAVRPLVPAISRELDKFERSQG